MSGESMEKTGEAEEKSEWWSAFAVFEKLKACVSKPERICGFLVFGPSEWLEERGPLRCHHN